MSVTARVAIASVLLVSVPGCRTRGGTTAGLVSAVSWSAGATLYATAEADRRDDRDVVVPSALLLTISVYALLAAVVFESKATAAEGDGGSYSYAPSYDDTYGAAPGADGADGTAGTGADPARAPIYRTTGAADVTCSFGDCRSHGSSGRTASGASIDTRCSFGDCDSHGWTTTVDGKSSESRCSFGDCNSHGWSTREADGSTSDTRCSFGDCSTHGWSTTTPEGTYETRCDFGDCNKHGWTTRNPDGSTTSCRCNFGDCDAHGVDCD